MLDEIAQLDADPGKVLSRMLETGEYLYLAQGPGGTWITAEEHRRGHPGLLIITEGLRRAEAARAAQPHPPFPLAPRCSSSGTLRSPARTPPRGRPKRSRRGRRQRRRRRLIPKRPTASCRSARTRSRRRCGIGRNDGAGADERRGPWRDQWCYAHHPDLPRCAWPRWALPQPPSSRATHAPTRHAVGLVTPVAANQIAAAAARRAYAYIVVEFVTIDVLLGHAGGWRSEHARPRQLA